MAQKGCLHSCGGSRLLTSHLKRSLFVGAAWKGHVVFFVIATMAAGLSFCQPTKASGEPSLTLFGPQIEGMKVTINGVTTPGTSGTTITRVHWSWGDGYEEDHWFPASHNYGNAGTYTVTVTAYQSNGQTAGGATIATVGDPPPAVLPPLWQHSWSWSTEDVAISDSGNVITAGTGGSGASRLDQQGNIIWNHFNEYTTYTSVSGDGRYVAVMRATFATADWVLYLYDPSGSLIGSYSTGLSGYTPNEGWFIESSQAGETIIATTFNYLIVVDSTGSLLWRQTSSLIRCAGVSRDGNVVAIGYSNSTVKVFGRQGGILWSHSTPAPVISLDLSHDGGIVATRNYPATAPPISYPSISVFDGTGHLLSQGLYTTSSGTSDYFQKLVAVSNDGARVYTSLWTGAGMQVTFYCFGNTGSQLWGVASGLHVWPNWIAVSANGEKVVFGSGSEDLPGGHIGHVHVFNKQGTLLWYYEDYTGGIGFLRVGISAEGTYVVASSWSGILFWAVPFLFSLGNSGSLTVIQGGSASNTITVAPVSGTPQTVTLSASGLPSGVSPSFNPSSGTPTFTSALTITISSTASAGLYNVTVTGVGGGVTRTSSFALTIQPRIVRPASYLANNPLRRVFFIFNNKKYYVTNMNAFNSYGFNWGNVKNYTQMNPDSYANSQINYDYLLDGKMQLPNRPYIAGDVNDGSLYYIPYYTWSGSKYPINWAGYNAYNGYLKTLLIRYGDPAMSLPVSSTVLNGTNPIPTTTPPAFVIGKNPLNRVFFIFNGYKYYFTDWPIYLGYGFTNANIDPAVNPDTYPTAQVRFDYLLEDTSSVFRKPLPNQPYIVGDVNDGSLYWVAYYTYTEEKYSINWAGYNGYGGQLKAMHTRYGDPSILLATSAYILDGVNPLPLVS